MAHPEQRTFMLSVKAKFPQFFKNVSVLDIGSLDINGCNRYLFEEYKYIGVDLGPGKNVDVVSRGHEFQSDVPFDIVISTECFEHDEHWIETIKNCIKLTKPGGLFVFTCATEGRQEHGTRRTTPQDSPFTSLIESDYYRNLLPQDILKEIDIASNFNEFYFNQTLIWPQDLYFFGVKRV